MSKIPHDHVDDNIDNTTANPTVSDPDAASNASDTASLPHNSASPTSADASHTSNTTISQTSESPRIALNSPKGPHKQTPYSSAKKKPPFNTHRSRALIFTAFFLGFAAIGISGGITWLVYHSQSQSADRINQLTAENVTLRETLSRTNRHMDQLDAQLKHVQTEQKNAQRTIESAVEKQINDLQDRFESLENQQAQPTSLATPLAAITDALTHAYRMLNFERNILGTIRLLERLAETYCSPPETVELIAVCTGLETDRAQLRQIPLPPMNRIILELSGIQQRFNTMATPPSRIETAPSAPLNTAAFTPSHEGILGLLETVGHNLSLFTSEHLVRIHRIDHDTTPLSIDQRQYVIKTLNLSLEQAKSAAIRRDQAVYVSAIEHVIQVTQSTLSQNHDSTNIIDVLNSLKQITLDPEPPRLTAAYAALADLAKAQKSGSQSPSAPNTNTNTNTNKVQDTSSEPSSLSTSE